MIPSGRAFYKMSGSGNDFVVVDARAEAPGELVSRPVIERICARGTGVGADGMVFLEKSRSADLRMTYLNSDGSLAALCGNATLCSARLALELGIVAPSAEFTIETGSGEIRARALDGNRERPEIDLQPVREIRRAVDEAPLQSGEQRIGFALAGVPHLVLLVDNVETVDVVGRGRPLRQLRTLPEGANVNFVSRGSRPNEWRIRTYERGVEAETLACGTGSVASAILLAEWGEAASPVLLTTRSGRVLRVRIRAEDSARYPSLSGEARIVFTGSLGEQG